MREKSTVNNRKKDEMFITPFSRAQERQNLQQVQICLQHNQALQFICFTCENKILCSQCACLSSHLQHDLKHIERSRQFLRSELQQWLIQLDSKSDRLDIVQEQLSSIIPETYISTQKYKDQIYRELSQLIDRIKDKMTDISNSITNLHNQYTHQIRFNIEQIKLKRRQIQTFSTNIKHKIESSTTVRLAELYNHKQNIFNVLVKEEEINFYKQKLIEPSWTLDASLLKDICFSIQKLSIELKSADFNKQAKQKLAKRSQSLRALRKQIKKTLKWSDIQKSEVEDYKRKISRKKASSSLKSILTPTKQLKQQYFKIKKSPQISLLKKKRMQIAKMVSMPVSPSKTMQNTHQITPDLSRQKLAFKKKQK